MNIDTNIEIYIDIDRGWYIDMDIEIYIDSDWDICKFWDMNRDWFV